MIKHGLKMIQAVSNIRVPKLSFIGASFGVRITAWPVWVMTRIFCLWPAARTMRDGGESMPARWKPWRLPVPKARQSWI